MSADLLFEIAADYLQRLKNNLAPPAALELSANGMRLRVSLDFPSSATDVLQVQSATDVPQVRQLPSRPATECEDDILAVLDDVGHRLVTDQIFSELAKRKMLHGDSTVKTALARMTADGRLTKDPHGNPRGYGLPEWNAKPQVQAERQTTSTRPLIPVVDSAQAGAVQAERQSNSPIGTRPSIADFQPSGNGHAKKE